MGGWVKHRADKRGKVGKLECKSFVTSLERADKKTRWVGKKLIVNLTISVTKWLWMASPSKGYIVLEGHDKFKKNLLLRIKISKIEIKNTILRSFILIHVHQITPKSYFPWIEQKRSINFWAEKLHL